MGALLSEALAAQGSFPPVYVTVITAGERSGNLTGVLEQYIAYLRVSTGFRSRLVTALIYPAVLVAVALLVVTYVVTYAMPQFADLYHELDIPFRLRPVFCLRCRCPCATISCSDRDCLRRSPSGLLWTRSRPRRPGNRPNQAPIPLSRRCLAEDSNRPVRAHVVDADRWRNPTRAALHTSSSAMGSALIANSVDAAAERK